MHHHDAEAGVHLHFQEKPSMVSLSPLSGLRLKKHSARKLGNRWELTRWSVSHVSLSMRKEHYVQEAALQLGLSDIFTNIPENDKWRTSSMEDDF